MTAKMNRIAIVVVSALVGLNALVPGWQIMTSGSVYGFQLPPEWLSGYWPFGDYSVAGFVLLVVVGGGCLLTAAIAAASERWAWMVSFVMGVVLVGWIAFELLFLTQTMIMTWIILGAGILLVALSLPGTLPMLRRSAGGRVIL